MLTNFVFLRTAVSELFYSAQARVDDLESQVNSDSEAIDKSFNIELMKMPPSLKKMRMGELLNGRQLLVTKYIYLCGVKPPHFQY